MIRWGAGRQQKKRCNFAIRGYHMLPGTIVRVIICLIFMLSATGMHAVATIQFTQEQARTLTGVSIETVRHWRKTVPYLASKRGKASRFTFADLVGLAVTNTLVSSLGIHIGTLSGGVDALFRMLATMGPTSLNEGIVLVTATNASLYEPGTDRMNLLSSAPALMIPLAPLVANLQRQVLPIAPISPQIELPFPPEAIRGRA
jgi:hypothetical protein